MNLSRKTRILLMLFGCLLLAFSACGSAGGTDLEKRDYSVIAERNPFGLRSPPPPQKKVIVALPKDEIFLTGITSIGEKQAYFMSKPRTSHAPQYFRLAVGESENGIEVLDIDPVAKAVRIQRDGIELTMTFPANGVRPPSVAGAVAAPVISPASPSGGTPGGTPQNTRLRTIPRRNARTASVSPLPANLSQLAVRPYASEQDIIMMELQKIANPHIQFPPTPGLPQ